MALGEVERCDECGGGGVECVCVAGVLLADEDAGYPGECEFCFVWVWPRGKNADNE